MTKDKALDLVLETLERMNHADSIFAGEFDKEIAAIKQARSAPVQKPDHGNELTIAYMSGLHDGKKKREWVSLTADERYDIRASFRGRFLETSEFAEQVQLATEAKLKERNT